MNYEAWQLQQKNLKDDERRKKTQAAEALRNYKGNAANSEAAKLSQIKEQDRIRKLEAERQLREYRGTLSEEDMKLAAYREEERRKKQEAAQHLRGYQGTISEEEAKRIVLREEELRRKQAEHNRMYQNLQPSRSQDDADFLQSIVPGSVSLIKDTFNAQSQSSMLSSKGTNATNSNPSMPGNKKLMAKFTFGIISADANAPIEGYLRSIDRLVTAAVGDEAKQSMRFEYPVVLEVKFDDEYSSQSPGGGQPETVRRLVTVGIPFQSDDRAVKRETKKKIIEAARTEIENGGFQRVR